MLASKSDYFHSLNRKSSGFMYHPQTLEPIDPYNSDPMYSPLRKTDSLREIAGTSRSYPKNNDINLNGSSGDRNSMGTTLNISQLDYPDYNGFFDNFDKIFKVSETSSTATPTAEQATQKKNICRVLLDEFEPDQLNPSMGHLYDVFHLEKSMNGFTFRDRGLPHLQHVPSKAYLGVKTEPCMSEMIPYNYKDICKEIVNEKNRPEALYGTGKGKLPDLKVPKALVHKFNGATGEGLHKGNEAKNKLHDNNVKLVGKVRVNIPVQAASNIETASVKHKNSQQALEKIIKPKKYSNIARSKTFVLEGKEKGQSQNEERMRVNSLQGIENGSKTTMAGQKTDFSLDLGPGSKSKFFLKGLEQRTTTFHNQPIVNKTQNEVKNVRNNVTSRTYYSKENMSFLSNSNKDRAFEGQFQKNGQEGVGMVGKSVDISSQAPSGFHGQTLKMGVEEISKLYKDLRQSIKLTESQKPMQHVRLNAKNLKPVYEGSYESVPQR